MFIFDISKDYLLVFQIIIKTNFIEIKNSHLHKASDY